MRKQWLRRRRSRTAASSTTSAAVVRALEPLERRMLLSGYNIGVNLDANLEFSAAHVWTDAAHVFSAWGDPGTPWNHNVSLTYNADGYPLQDAAIYSHFYNYNNGTYVLQYSYYGHDADGNPLAHGEMVTDTGYMGRSLTVTSSNEDPLTHLVTVTANLKIQHDSGNVGGLLILGVQDNVASNPIRDIHLWIPGATIGGTPFTSDFLKSLAPFPVLRTLDWSGTNNNAIVNWSDRVQTTSNSGGSLPWETIVDLANATNKNLWINVPDQANDDYVTQLATLIHQRLNPNLTVRVEYSNEVWNSVFTQSGRVLTNAKANPAIPKTDANGGTIDDFSLLGMQYAYRAKQIGDIFRTVWGADASRLSMVLGGQCGVTHFDEVGLALIQSLYGNPGQYFNEMAIAPYVGNDLGYAPPGGWTLDSLFSNMQSWTKSTLSQWIQNAKSLATQNGISSLAAYEAGQALSGNGAISSALAEQAQGDHRMYILYQDLFKVWLDDGGGQFQAFSHVGVQGWSLLEDPTLAGSPKWDAVMNLNMLPGDSTLDGSVTFADFQILRDNYGKSGTFWWSQGDYNGDNVVNAQDWALMYPNLDFASMTPAQLAEVQNFMAGTQSAVTMSVNPVTTSYGNVTSLSATLSAGTGPLAGYALAFSLNGVAKGTAITNANGVATITVARLGSTPAGSYPTGVGVSFAGNAVYAPSSATAALTVNPAPLTLTVTNASKTYGQNNPAFALSASGLLGGDTLTSLGVPQFTTMADATSPVGSYAVSASGLTAPNYTVTYVDGTLTVKPATLTVAADPKHMAVNTFVPSLTGSITGVQNGDDLSATFTTTATDSSPMGAYPITAFVSDPNGALSNYTLSAQGSQLTVTPDTMSVSFGSALSANAGGSVHLPVLVTDNAYGLVSADLNISYDNTRLHLANADVTLPAALASAGWGMEVKVDDSSGLARVSLYGGNVGLPAGAVQLLDLNFHVDPNAPVGPTTVSVGDNPVPSQLNEGEIAINETDGTINVASNLSVAITGAPSASVSEGTTVSLGSTSTGGTAPIAYNWHVTASNGQTIADGNQSSFAFTPGDEGSYVVTLTATDGANTIATATTTVSVTNVAPSNVVLQPLSAILEGGSVSLSGSFVDPGTLDTHTVQIDWGDSSTPSTANLAAGVTTFSGVQHTYLNNKPGNAPYTITVTVTDEHNASSNPATTTVVVQNVPPTVAITNLPTNNTSPEAIALTLGSQVTDPAAALDAPYTYAWSVVADNGQLVPGGAGTGLSFTPSRPGTYTVTLQVTDKDGGVGTSTAILTVSHVTFRVTQFSNDASGFQVQFNRPADTTLLNLYSGQNLTLGSPDVTLVGKTSGLIRGSLVWDPTTNTARFVKTGSVLAADTYTVTLFSRSDGWVDKVSYRPGEMLDGNGDGTVGDNYTTTFSIAPSTAPVVSLRDFARGPGQTVNLPTQSVPSGVGMPISISDGTGVTSVSLALNYDPSLLTISGAAMASGISGWTFSTTGSTAGHLVLSASGPALSAGAASLFNLAASVPGTSVANPGPSMGAAQVLTFSNLQVLAGTTALPVVADDAVQKIAFVGDATGDHSYSAMDASLIARSVVGYGDGFDAYPLTDPVIVADVSGSGTVSGLDASLVANAAAGISVVQLPTLPAWVPAAPATPGSDPTLVVSNVLAAPGKTVVVPINITDSAAGMQAIDLSVNYDPAVFDPTTVTAALGTLDGSWTMIQNLATSGLVRVSLYNTNPVVGGTGSVLNVSLGVRATAAGGLSAISISTAPAAPTRLNEGALGTSATNGQAAIDNVPPKVVISTVGPSVRNTALASVTLTASEPLNALHLSDLTLTRNGSANLLTGNETLTKVDGTHWALGGLSALTTTDGTYVLSLQTGPGTITDIAGNALATVVPAIVTVDHIAPVVVSSALLNSAKAQIRFQFSETLNKALSVNALTVKNLTSGQTIDTSAMLVTYNPTTQMVTWTFPGLANGMLPDGNYQATLSTTGLTDLAGNAMTSPSVLNFSVLAGDANHDGKVDFSDYTILSKNLGKTNATLSDGDFNGDGVIDTADVLIFTQQYGKVLQQAQTAVVTTPAPVIGVAPPASLGRRR